MNKLKTIGGLLSGLLLLLLGLTLIVYHSKGYLIVIIVLSITFVIKGIRKMIYYFSMARCMVGGQKILVDGIILLELGVFAATLSQVPKIYVVIYLVFTLMFGGVVYFLKALEEKKHNAPGWQLKIAAAGVHLALGVACFFALRYTDIAVVIYGISLCYTAIVKIMHTFRKTEMIYIQ